METKIQSFATFSETRKAAIDTKIKEEASTKRTTESQRFTDLLAEYEVTTVAEIAEEQRTEFFAKLVGEIKNLETEGNAFGAAVKKAKEEGEKEFKVDGETYKVEESKVEEAEVKSDEDFMEMVMTMYKEAFGDDFDETKATEAGEGMLKKADGDYGAAVGMLQSSLG
jgi:hypothetical protein